jgi:hypothetical protein
MSASTQQTSGSAAQIAASAHELAGSAEALNRLVGRFQIQLEDKGSVADVLRAARDAHNAWNARLRDAIKTATTSRTFEQAAKDDGCTFGKWLHGPGDFRDREPQRWQQLHDLHEQFHDNAAEILKLATTGQTAKATERMQYASERFRQRRATTTSRSTNSHRNRTLDHAAHETSPPLAPPPPRPPALSSNAHRRR